MLMCVQTPINCLCLNLSGVVQILLGGVHCLHRPMVSCQSVRFSKHQYHQSKKKAAWSLHKLGFSGIVVIGSHHILDCCLSVSHICAGWMEASVFAVWRPGQETLCF